MITANLLNLIGLSFNSVASIIMLYSFLKITRNVDDDYIINMDKNGNYTQKKHVKNRKFGIIGFSLYVVGFILQFISILT